MNRLLRKIAFRGSVYAADPQVWSDKCVSNGDVATIQGFECLFVNILRVATTVAGLAFGLMFIIGGFQLIFAGGDQANIKKAQGTFTSAIIGLVITIGAWFVLLLIENFTGVNVTDFTVPGP